MQEQSTRVPEILSALAAGARSVLSDVTVLVGPRVIEELGPRVLIVGWPGDDGATVQNRLTRSPEFGHRYEEQVEVRCAVSVVSGSTDAEPLLADARAVLASVEAWMKANPALGGVVDLAGFGPDARWLMGQTPDGAALDVFFSVIAQSLL